MAKTKTPDYPKGLTFEKVWAMYQETDRKFQETDRKFQESREEADRRAQEAERRSQEADKRMKKLEEVVEETNRKVGGLGSSIGGLVETLFAAKLWEKFASYPYKFKRAYRRVQVFNDTSSRELTDIDILLSDTNWVMAVEVKGEVNYKDVERHIKRMNIILEYPPAEARGKKLLGAMAGGTIDPDALEFAYESGFFVLELKGESVNLLTPPEGFNPEWGVA